MRSRQDSTSGQGDFERLSDLCEAALPVPYGTSHHGAQQRLAHELALIRGRGLATQFLAVADIVRGIRDQGVLVGPGRGPNAGSIVLRLLGITGIDPIANGLLFERFIRSAERDVEIEIDIAASQLGRLTRPETTEGRTGLCTRHFIELGGHRVEVFGLRTLDRIADTIALVVPGASPNHFLSVLPLNDEATFAVLSSARTHPLFMLESVGARRFLRDLQPRTFDELTALFALYRPGAIPVLQEYVRLTGEAAEATCLPAVDDITDSSRGLLIYQEQVMQVAMRIGGLSGLQAERLWRAFARRESAIIASMTDEFFKGAEEAGYSLETAQSIWNALELASGRAFCRAHHASYALVAYWDAYMQAHFAAERTAVRD